MTSPDALVEKGRLLFAQRCDFVKGAVDMEGLPLPELPEIAFAGRSNVGKSSLVNALTGRKSLARASVTPGRTREINFFTLGDRLMIVDLPGYGYAKMPKAMVENWTELVKMYLVGRQTLQRVCLLIDARHGIMKNDTEIMKMLDDSAVSYQVVLTKLDKLKPKEIEAVQEKVLAQISKHPAAYPQIIATSSEDKRGIEELRAALAFFVD